MKVTIPETVMVNEVGQEAVLLDLASGEYYSLNPSALTVWRALAEHGSVEKALPSLTKQFQVDPATVERDAREFAASLAARRLLLVVDDGPSAS